MAGVENAQVAIFIADTRNSPLYLMLTAATYSWAWKLLQEGRSIRQWQTAEEIQIDAANKTIQDFELILQE